MPTWLSIELVLGALLATSFASVGLVALWAATSSRHWFLRAVVMLAVLAAPLVVSAYEPLVLFSVEAAIIVAGVNLWRWLANTSRAGLNSQTQHVEQPAQPRWQFSLAAFLLATALIAAALAPAGRVAQYFSPMPRAAWTSMLGDGAAAGGIVLLVAWFLVTPRRRLRWPATLASLALLTAAAVASDWIYLAFTWDVAWPPDVASFPSLIRRPDGFSIAYVQPAGFWLGVTAATGVFTLCAILLAHTAGWSSEGISNSSAATREHTIRGRLATTCLVISTLLLAALPTYVLCQLTHRLPIPAVTLPNPNGLDDVAAAGQAFSKSQLLHFFSPAEPKSTDELAAEIAKYSSAYNQLRLGLTREIHLIVFPVNGKLDAYLDSWRKVQDTSHASKALMRQAQLARRQGRFGDSAQFALEDLQLAGAISHGGDYLAHVWSIVLIEGAASKELHESTGQLTPSECRDAIVVLTKLDAQRESLATAELRTRIRDENSFGWVGKLIVVVSELANQYPPGHEQSVRRHQLSVVWNHLLTAELALQAFQQEHAALPDNLNQLVPNYLNEIPTDPFDLGGLPLRYRRDGNSFLVYSIGPDTTDNAGRPPDNDDSGFQAAEVQGDLRLDTYFAPAPTPAPANSGNNAVNGPAGPSAAESQSADDNDGINQVGN